MRKPVEQIEEATILFAGDSGDGSQTIGTQMTETTALVGNDVATLPDYPAEIRAPRRVVSRYIRVPTPLLKRTNSYPWRSLRCTRRHESRRLKGSPSKT